MLLKPSPVTSTLLAAVLLIGISFQTARALDVVTFDVVAQGSGVGDMTGVRVSIFDQMNGPDTSPTYRLLENFTFTPADVGSTFNATSATDSDFATFERMITNGVNDGFGYGVENLPTLSGSAQSWTESNLFAAGTRPFGPGNFSSIGQLFGPDFAGYDITQVVLTINSFTLSSGGGFSSYDFRGTAKIVAVPEPSNVALLATGALAASRRWRRQR